MTRAENFTIGPGGVMDHPAGRPSTIRIWMMAARIPTLPAAVVPVLVGSATAYALRGTFLWGAFAAAMIVSLLIQIGTNLINDLLDFRKGADAEGRLGPVRVTTAGLLTPRQVTRGIFLVMGLAILFGAYLVALRGWPILVIGIASLTCAYLYTGGPWPLAYHGLGDIFAFIFFGLVAVGGTHYLHTGTVDTFALAAAVPVGLLVTAILIVNNLRDIPTDRVAGKHTLAVRLGDSGTRWFYTIITLGAFLVPPLIWLIGDHGIAILLPTLMIRPALGLVRKIMRGTRGLELNLALAETGKLHLGYGLLFAIGIFFS